MNQPLQIGLSATRRVDIDAGRTINFMGSDCHVYSTPNLVYDVDLACRDLLLEHIEPGKGSVCTRVELDHVGPTLIGMWVDITVTLISINGGAVIFEFTATDALGEVARGKHSRFIVGIEKIAQRLKSKLARAMGQA